MKIYIYILLEPDGVTVRYVGKSNEFRFGKRLTEHCRLSQLKFHTHKNNWIKSLLSNGNRPIIKIIEECEESNFREREQFWVDFYKKQGCDLTNGTKGGEGAIRIHNRVISLEQRKKIGETWKKHPNFFEICAKGGRCRRNVKRNFKFQQSSIHAGINQMKSGRWRAYLWKNKQQIHVGVYDSESDAFQARESKRIEMNL